MYMNPRANMRGETSSIAPLISLNFSVSLIERASHCTESGSGVWRDMFSKKHNLNASQQCHMLFNWRTKQSPNFKGKHGCKGLTTAVMDITSMVINMDKKSSKFLFQVGCNHRGKWVKYNIYFYKDHKVV